MRGASDVKAASVLGDRCRCFRERRVEVRAQAIGKPGKEEPGV